MCGALSPRENESKLFKIYCQRECSGGEIRSLVERIKRESPSPDAYSNESISPSGNAVWLWIVKSLILFQ